jgi:BMFP domain-containing protein YqiC
VPSGKKLFYRSFFPVAPRQALYWCERLVVLRDVGAWWLRYLCTMIDPKFFDELRSRIDAALRDSPAQDLEKNLRALLAAWFDRLDLVLREDFEVQKKLLERAQAKLAELEARIAELEARKPGRE